jgi:NADH-quinone oxidoreductase subunit M
MASMGLPGFSGFVAELQVLVGAWMARPWWTRLRGVGIVVGVAYTWRAMQKAFFSDLRPSVHMSWSRNTRIRLRRSPGRRLQGVVLLAGVSLALVGLYPKILLDTIEPAVKALLAGGGR